jgi:hypothetical protein
MADVDGATWKVGQLARLTGLTVRTLHHYVARVELLGPPSSADLLALMEEVMKMDEIMNRYFTEEQLAALTQRHEQAGKQSAASVIAEWPRLIAQVQAEMDAGTDPGAPKVQAPDRLRSRANAASSS